MNNIISRIRRELEANVDEKTRDSAHRFFREPIKLYGIKTHLISQITRKYFDEIKNMSKEEIFSLCEELLKSDYSEEAWIAFEWSDRLHKQYTPSDFEIFESWIEKYVNNWAKCDTFCNHTIGTFIEMYPQYKNELLKWAHSNNRWFRRAAAVTLILPARKGNFLDEIFKIADILLKDSDDLVQKSYGWLLKEASKSHLDEVFDYVMQNKAVMPRTALRYAIEKMPKELKDKAMSK